MVKKWSVAIPKLSGEKTRRVYLYLPDSYEKEPDKHYPVMYMFDGHNVFFDEDGRCWLYYSRCCYKHPVESEVAEWARQQGIYDEIEESWIYGVEIAPDFSKVIGEPQLLLCPPSKMDDKQAEWESRSVTAKEANRRWTEGSFLIKKDGIYYMMYSANFFLLMYLNHLY